MIFTIIERCKSRKARRVHLSLPTIITSKGQIMKTLTLPNNAQAIITPEFEDQFGLPAAAPATTGTVTSSDATLFSAALTDDGKVVVVAVEGASGTGELTYTNGTLTDSGSVSVAAPVATSVVLDSTDAVITAQPSTASTAPAPAPALTPAAPITTVLPQ